MYILGPGWGCADDNNSLNVQSVLLYQSRWMVWRLAGRRAEEVASAYVSKLQREQDIKHIIYWVDSYNVHSKNWYLLKTLVIVVNIIGGRDTEVL